jgi:hypothetical protein
VSCEAAKQLARQQGPFIDVLSGKPSAALISTTWETYGKSPYLMGKAMVSCKFSLKPIQSYGKTQMSKKEALDSTGVTGHLFGKIYTGNHIFS